MSTITRSVNGQTEQHSFQRVDPLLWVPRYWPSVGGAELHARRLAQELSTKADVGVITHCDQTGVDLTIATSEACQNTTLDGAVTRYMTGISGVRGSALQKMAKKAVVKQEEKTLFGRCFKSFYAPQVKSIAARYGVIHYIHNGFVESAELAADTAESLDLPFVITPLIHTNVAPDTGWDSARFRRLYERANAIITLTKHEKDWLIERDVRANKIHIAPYGPLVSKEGDGKRFRAQQGLDNEPVVLFLSRVTREKGCHALLDAAGSIWAEHPDTRIVFVGPQDNEARSALEACEDKRIITIETITENGKSDALAACDLMCMPSQGESLGVPYLEAWHFSKPVVALDIPVLREVITDEVNGLLTQPDSESIATAVNRLIASPARREVMGDAGRQEVLMRYSWEKLGSHLQMIYEKVLPLEKQAGISPAASRQNFAVRPIIDVR